MQKTKALVSSYEFPLVAFLTGAAVLVLELSATRILSPYFGNTIFSFSSVITTILAALSAGYYIGGTRADQEPSPEPFYKTILFGGLSVCLLQVLSLYLLPLLGRLPITWGPLVSAAMMFFLPAFFLGMLSPHAVKLQAIASTTEGVGTVSGTIFFWSTLGSLFGSLSTGFVLIPRIGLQAILLGVGGALLAVALGGLALHNRLRPRYLVHCVAAVIVSGLLVGVRTQTIRNTYVFLKDGVYERLAIQDKQTNGSTVRRFFQDRSTSGAIRLASDELGTAYSRYYELYRVFTPNLKDALFIGGGIYSMPNQLLKQAPEATVHVAEIEPSLKGLAERYFNLRPTGRLVNHLVDGRRLLSESDQNYDFVFSDVYNSLFSIPSHFTTTEFFVVAKSRLRPGGVFIANIIGTLKDSNPSFVKSELKTFTDIFPASYVFAVQDPLSTSRQNLILVGVNRQDAVPLDRFANSNGAALVEKFKSHLVDLSQLELDRHPTLTDDYAPVEYFNASVMDTGTSVSHLLHSAWKRGVALVVQRRGNQSVSLQHARRTHLLPKGLYFDGERALSLVDQQLQLGARHIGSEGHTAVQDLIERTCRSLGLPVYRQTWKHEAEDGSAVLLSNLIVRINEGAVRRILVGTHYDTRSHADRDHVHPEASVPGANDGSSGTAVLLELARSLKTHVLPREVGVDLVFFDGEEGEAGTAKWRPIGSEYFAANLGQFYAKGRPALGVVIDMVGDGDLEIFKDTNSVAAAQSETNRFWDLARKEYGAVFKEEARHKVRDDHTALNRAGIPSFVVIDFDYPYFHTTEDTLNKISGESLNAVGESLFQFLQQESKRTRV